MNPIVLSVREATREWVKREFKEILFGVWDATREFLVDVSFTVALIGGGICILMWVAGWKDGFRWTGILFVGNVLIRFLLR